MGKRKRHTDGSLDMSGSEERHKKHKRKHREKRDGSRLSAPSTACPKDVGIAGRSLGAEKRKTTTTQSEVLEDVRPQDPKRKGHKKNNVDVVSGAHPQRAGSMSAPRDSVSQPTRDRPSAVLEGIKDSVEVPQSLSRSGRRRWMRKLIRKGLLPKEQGAALQTRKQQKSRARPPPHADVAVSWIDKPIGRKALLRQLATTRLMKAPVKQWNKLDRQSTAASTAQEGASTAWRRSATDAGQVVLSARSTLDASQGAAAEDIGDSRLIAPKVPKIRTTSTDNDSTGQRRKITSLRDGLPPDIVPGHVSHIRGKRSSFGSKATSVPTFEVDGNIAERFKRFSAAVKGKAVNDSDDSTSDETSENDSDEGRPSSSTEILRSPLYRDHISGPAQATKWILNGDVAASVGESDDGSSKKDHAGNAGSQHEGSSTTAPRKLRERQQAMPEVTSRDESRPDDEMPSFSKLVPRSSKSWLSDVWTKHAVFGSDLGGGSYGSRLASEQGTDASQESVSAACQALQLSIPFTSIDDEAFDPHRAIEEVFQNEMTLTRELPAGKDKFDSPADLDGHLTYTSSDRRVTRSASERKPALSSKRADSAIAQPEQSVVIVRSMHLAETESPTTGREEAHHGQGDTVANGGEDEENPVSDRRTLTKVASAPDTSSSLPVPTQSPSPPQNTASSVHEAAKSQPDRATTDGFEEEGKIDLATVDQATESRKKRKMTGRTSKHFSTSKKKSTMDRAIATDKMSPTVMPPSVVASAQLSTNKKRTRSPVDETLLSETKSLTGGDNHLTGLSARESKKRSRRNVKKGMDELSTDGDADHDGANAKNVDTDEDEVEASRPKKRSRRISGTLANLSASNILESRSRRSTNTAMHTADTFEPRQDADMDTPARNRIGYEDTAGHGEKGKGPKKRSRGSSGTLADLDASNIIPRRSRFPAEPTASSRAEEPVQRKEVAPQDTSVACAEDVADDIEEVRRPKKRSRRSSGTIANLDASNILQTRSRRSKAAGPGLEDPTDHVAEADDAAHEVDEPAAPKPRAKRKSTGKRSIYFTPPKPALDPTIVDRVDFYNSTGKSKRAPAGTSTAPVPSIHSDRFGIIQEKLWREPFWLIIAVTFLNKTAGRAAAPVFWRLKERFATPEALAQADCEELLEMVWHLGLQTQRSKRLIKIAAAWVEAEPVKGVRWRTLHYPLKGDGKEYKAGVPVEEDADEVAGALELGRIPGCGAYAWDSWRIFCRDVLRGVADDYEGQSATAEGFVPEWQKVIPLDKELRACLRWMWLREGWIWDHETGAKRRATQEEMERAVRGEMEVSDEKEKKFAAQAAGVAVSSKGGPSPDVSKHGDGSDPPSPPRSAEVSVSTRTRKRKASYTASYTATAALAEDDAEDDGSSDNNIVVSSPAKASRTSGRVTRKRG